MEQNKNKSDNSGSNDKPRLYNRKIDILPKNVRIEWQRGIQLNIVDHRVKQGHGILGFMLNAVINHTLEEYSQRLEEHGISFDIFKKASILELSYESRRVIKTLLGNYYCRDIDAYSIDPKEFADTDAGLEITNDIISEIDNCENWRDFHNIMTPESEFFINTKRKAESLFGEFFQTWTTHSKTDKHSQSLVRLPETVDLKINDTSLHIRDHRVASGYGLYVWVSDIIQYIDSQRCKNSEFTYDDWNTVVTNMEKQGLVYEAVIEWCVQELENKTDILEHIVYFHYNITRIQRKTPIAISLEVLSDFLKNDRGRSIANQLIEKIRSCDDWQDFYDEMRLTSRFNMDLKNRIQREVDQCLKI